MQEFRTGAVRDTGGKGRMDLLPMCSLLRVSKHMEDALANYPERNWEKGLPMHSMIDSAFRHLVKYMDGQNDEDHLCAAATNLLMAMWTEEKRAEMQDIPSRWPPDHCPSFPTNEVDREAGLMPKAKEDPKEGQRETCACYGDGATCIGTREHETCSCGGDKSKCDFYPGMRK